MDASVYVRAYIPLIGPQMATRTHDVDYYNINYTFYNYMLRLETPITMSLLFKTPCHRPYYLILSLSLEEYGPAVLYF